MQQIQWSWTVQAQPPVLQGVAVAAGVLSAVIVWCNVTVGISSSLSPLYQLITWSEHEFFSQVCPHVFLQLTCIHSCAPDCTLHLVFNRVVTLLLMESVSPACSLSACLHNRMVAASTTSSICLKMKCIDILVLCSCSPCCCWCISSYAPSLHSLQSTWAPCTHYCLQHPLRSPCYSMPPWQHVSQHRCASTTCT